MIGGISQKMLTQTLRDLERYELTRLRRALGGPRGSLTQTRFDVGRTGG